MHTKGVLIGICDHALRELLVALCPIGLVCTDCMCVSGLRQKRTDGEGKSLPIYSFKCSSQWPGKEAVTLMRDYELEADLLSVRDDFRACP